MHFPKSQMSHRKLVGCWPCGPPDSVWGLPSLGATNVFTEPALWNKYCFDKSCDIKFLPSRRMQSEASTTLHAWPHPFRGSSSPSPHPKAPVRVKKTHQTGEPTKACKARQIVSSHLDFSKQTHSMEEKKKKSHFPLRRYRKAGQRDCHDSPWTWKLPGWTQICRESSIITCPVCTESSLCNLPSSPNCLSCQQIKVFTLGDITTPLSCM